MTNEHKDAALTLIFATAFFNHHLFINPYFSLVCLE